MSVLTKTQLEWLSEALNLEQRHITAKLSELYEAELIFLGYSYGKGWTKGAAVHDAPEGRYIRFRAGNTEALLFPNLSKYFRITHRPTDQPGKYRIMGCLKDS
jgi:DNA-binding transcriptional ArsR family regulator